MCETVAIIGSFRKHYQQVLSAHNLFVTNRLRVTSPLGAAVVDTGEQFVRFVSDPTDWSDPLVQTVALHRILRADFVVAIAPEGYVGKTTCYEIGRILQARRPLYFTEAPDDLPIKVPEGFVISCEEIVKNLSAGVFKPVFWYEQLVNCDEALYQLETDLSELRFRPEHELPPESPLAPSDCDLREHELSSQNGKML